MYDRLWVAHPFLTFFLSACVLGIVGFAEYVGYSRRAAYWTWGVGGVSLIAIMILQFVG